MQLTRLQHGVILSSVLVVGLAWAPRASAEDHVKGVIEARASDGTLTLRANDATKMTLVVKDLTEVRSIDGLRQNDETTASLITGLRVDAYGDFEGANAFIARKVTYTRANMKTALAIKAGVAPTDARSVDNQRRITENERLIAQQQQTLAHQASEIATNSDRINANEQKIVATSGSVAALDDYNVISSVTIYFRNGQAGIAPEYKAQLDQLVARSKDVKGYKIQVQGYASTTGSLAFNQQLSQKRAIAVTAALQQSGVPPTNIVVPAAMGISDQVSTDKTEKGQAENRRTVVTLLQNKGFTGQ